MFTVYLWRLVLQSWTRRHLWGTGWCSGRGPALHAVPPPGKSPSAACDSTESAWTCPAARRFSADNQKRSTERERESIECTDPTVCVYLHLSKSLKIGKHLRSRQEDKTGLELTTWEGKIINVINVTGHNRLFAFKTSDTGLPGCCCFQHRGSSWRLLPC